MKSSAREPIGNKNEIKDPVMKRRVQKRLASRRFRQRKDQQISSLNEEKATKDQQISSLNEEIATKYQQISSLNKEIQRLQQENAELVNAAKNGGQREECVGSKIYLSGAQEDNLDLELLQSLTY